MKDRYPDPLSKLREDLLVAQKGLCGTCYQKKKLVIDHNHTTGEIRGLLCKSCNVWLGKMEKRLRRSFKNYLSFHYYVGKLAPIAKKHMEDLKQHKIVSKLLKEANKPIKVHCVNCREEYIILTTHFKRAICNECNGKLK